MTGLPSAAPGTTSARRSVMPLDEDVTRLAKGKNLATVVTLMPSGQPQALLTWVDADDEHVLVNTEPQRQRARNIARDPRITVLIHGEDPYDWAEVRGHVVETVTGDEARRHIDELARKYTGQDYAAPVSPHGRVNLKIATDKVNTPRLLGRYRPRSSVVFALPAVGLAHHSSTTRPRVISLRHMNVTAYLIKDGRH